MNVAFNRVSMRLGRRQFVSLVDAAGMTITCIEGCLWITQHRDSRDIVLRAYEFCLLDRPGLAIIQALTESTVGVEEPASARGRSPARILGLLRVKSGLAPKPPGSADLIQGVTTARA